MVVSLTTLLTSWPAGQKVTQSVDIRQAKGFAYLGVGKVAVDEQHRLIPDLGGRHGYSQGHGAGPLPPVGRTDEEALLPGATRRQQDIVVNPHEDLTGLRTS